MEMIMTMNHHEDQASKHPQGFEGPVNPVDGGTNIAQNKEYDRTFEYTLDGKAMLATLEKRENDKSIQWYVRKKDDKPESSSTRASSYLQSFLFETFIRRQTTRLIESLDQKKWIKSINSMSNEPSTSEKTESTSDDKVNALAEELNNLVKLNEMLNSTSPEPDQNAISDFLQSTHLPSVANRVIITDPGSIEQKEHMFVRYQGQTYYVAEAFDHQTQRRQCRVQLYDKKCIQYEREATDDEKNVILASLQSAERSTAQAKQLYSKWRDDLKKELNQKFQSSQDRTEKPESNLAKIENIIRNRIDETMALEKGDNDLSLEYLQYLHLVFYKAIYNQYRAWGKDSDEITLQLIEALKNNVTLETLQEKLQLLEKLSNLQMGWRCVQRELESDLKNIPLSDVRRTEILTKAASVQPEEISLFTESQSGWFKEQYAKNQKIEFLCSIYKKVKAISDSINSQQIELLLGPLLKLDFCEPLTHEQRKAIIATCDKLLTTLSQIQSDVDDSAFREKCVQELKQTLFSNWIESEKYKLISLLENNAKTIPQYSELKDAIIQILKQPHADQEKTYALLVDLNQTLSKSSPDLKAVQDRCASILNSTAFKIDMKKIRDLGDDYIIVNYNDQDYAVKTEIVNRSWGFDMNLVLYRIERDWTGRRKLVNNAQDCDIQKDIQNQLKDQNYHSNALYSVLIAQEKEKLMKMPYHFSEQEIDIFISKAASPYDAYKNLCMLKEVFQKIALIESRLEKTSLPVTAIRDQIKDIASKNPSEQLYILDAMADYVVENSAGSWIENVERYKKQLSAHLTSMGLTEEEKDAIVKAALSVSAGEMSEVHSDLDKRGVFQRPLAIERKMKDVTAIYENIAEIDKIIKQGGIAHTQLTQEIQKILSKEFAAKAPSDQKKQFIEVVESLSQHCTRSVESTTEKGAVLHDQLEASFFAEVVKEIDALKQKQKHKIAPNQENASDFGSVETTDYRARAHNDAQKAISELVDKGFTRSEIGPANNCYHYSLLDTQFSLTDYLKNKPVDLREKFNENQQEHFDDYNAAFAEAFTCYYQELHAHMKSHSTLSQQNGRTYYTVNRPQDSNVRGQDEFEYSFEKNPQKENIVVIDREIKEMVSAYQTAFFILESLNSNKDLAKDRHEALTDAFRSDIGELLKERADCIKQLNSKKDLKKDIPQAPIYHVIASSERVLEVRADAQDGQLVREKDLEWKEGGLKEIFSWQNMLNYLMRLTRGFRRYVSMLTSSHHAQLIFTGKIRAHNRTTATLEQLDNHLKTKSQGLFSQPETQSDQIKTDPPHITPNRVRR